MPNLIPRMLPLALASLLAASTASAQDCTELTDRYNVTALELQAAHDEFAATLLDGSDCRHPLTVATTMEAKKRTMLDMRKEMEAKGCAATGGAPLSELEANVAEGPEMLAKMKQACDAVEAAAEPQEPTPADPKL